VLSFIFPHQILYTFHCAPQYRRRWYSSLLSAVLPGIHMKMNIPVRVKK
jgi:hypothetical protein